MMSASLVAADVIEASCNIVVSYGKSPFRFLALLDAPLLAFCDRGCLRTGVG